MKRYLENVTNAQIKELFDIPKELISISRFKNGDKVIVKVELSRPSMFDGLNEIETLYYGDYGELIPVKGQEFKLQPFDDESLKWFEMVFKANIKSPNGRDYANDFERAHQAVIKMFYENENNEIDNKINSLKERKLINIKKQAEQTIYLISSLNSFKANFDNEKKKAVSLIKTMITQMSNEEKQQCLIELGLVSEIDKKESVEELNKF